jgi:hypothetical protein
MSEADIPDVFSAFGMRPRTPVIRMIRAKKWVAG